MQKKHYPRINHFILGLCISYVGSMHEDTWDKNDIPVLIPIRIWCYHFMFMNTAPDVSVFKSVLGSDISKLWVAILA